jgi:hypothetical protein
MAAYCYWGGMGYEPIGIDPENPGWICIDVPDIEIPPIPPVEGEEDPSGEITLPDGTVVDATALSAPFVGLKQIAWQGEPYKTLWGVRTDGLLVGMTYDKDEDVWGWHRHPMTNGAVVSIAVISSATTEQDELWAVIQREINGSTVHYIERMTPRIEPEDENDKDSYNFLDCSLSYSGSATTSFSGADHLEGETCRVWADGIDVGDVTITGGAFTLDYAAAEVKVGILTTASLISLPVARLSTERQIISGIVIRFYETLGGKAGTLPNNMDTLQFREVNTAMDDSPPMRDGDYELKGVGGSWDDTGVYTIQQDTAGPMTIVAIFPSYRASPT